MRNARRAVVLLLAGALALGIGGCASRRSAAPSPAATCAPAFMPACAAPSTSAAAPGAAAPCTPCAARSPCGCDPHGSPAAFLATHLSPELWATRVLPDYLSRRDAMVPVLLGGAALLAIPFDDRIEREVSGTLGDRAILGDVGANGLVVASITLGLLCPGEGRTAKDVTWTQAEALGLTLGVTEGLKALVGRQRPEDSNDTSSFPSGHTAMAFCAATLIERNCGPKLGLLAYGVATLTGLSRIEAGKHFPTDVLAGAAIGTLIAGLVDALHFGRGGGDGGICGTSFVPEVGTSADGGGFALGVSVRF